MNGIDPVRRAFRSKYSIDVPSNWLQACVTWLRDQYQLADLTSTYTLERIYQQWLHTDLTLLGDAYCLPTDLDLNAKKVQLTGKYTLQINRIFCISEPYYSQVLSIHGDLNENERIDTDITETQQWKPPPPKRVLYLDLTDGKIILRGLEYETIGNLDRDSTLPGAKILVSGPVLFRRGMLLLTGKNTQVLGGYVEELLDRNGSIETALFALSKTASKLQESRVRFDRLNMKLQLNTLIENATNSNSVTDNIRTNPATSYEDEDEMDAFIRQAYADGMLEDDSHTVVSNAVITNSPPPPPPRMSTENSRTNDPSIHVSNRNDTVEELVVASDEDEPHFEPEFLFEIPTNSISPSLTSVKTIPIIKVSMPYTYLSLIRSQKNASTKLFQDHRIKGCFSSLAKNPHLVKNEFVLEAYVNDGSDCLLVRLASDLLAQRIGITVTELQAKRKQIQTDMEKQAFQANFNERLRRFGNEMAHLHSIMTIRFYSDDQKPIVISIDES